MATAYLLAFINTTCSPPVVANVEVRSSPHHELASSSMAVAEMARSIGEDDSEAYRSMIRAVRAMPTLAWCRPYLERDHARIVAAMPKE